MLDLVPLAGPRRKMTHMQDEPSHVGQTLQLPLPQTDAIAIAAAAEYIGVPDRIGRSLLVRLRLLRTAAVFVVMHQTMRFSRRALAPCTFAGFERSHGWSQASGRQ
jgi:hypothetical protein